MSAVQGEQQMLNMSLATRVMTVTGDKLIRHFPNEGQVPLASFPSSPSPSH
jgi:hypothetical protein